MENETTSSPDFAFESAMKWNLSECLGGNVHVVGICLPTAAVLAAQDLSSVLPALQI